jgi:hypothetical protein
MIVKQLLTPIVAKEMSEFRDRFPICDIKSCKEVEEDLFNSILGYDFYDLLLDSLTDFSTATPWSAATAYAVDNLVTDKYYQAISINTNSQPPAVTSWKLAPTFQNACYEELWCRYLGRYLSLSVYDWEYRLNPSKEEKDYPLTPAEMKQAVVAIQEAIQRVFNNMRIYVEKIRKLDTNPCYAAFEKFMYFEPLEGSCGNETTASKGGQNFDYTLWH